MKKALVSCLPTPKRGRANILLLSITPINASLHYKERQACGERAKMVRAEENPHEKGAMGILGSNGPIKVGDEGSESESKSLRPGLPCARAS